MKWFCKHDWSRWSEIIPTHGINNQQWRCCEKCGILKKRNLGYCSGITPYNINRVFKKLFTKYEDLTNNKQ